MTRLQDPLAGVNFLNDVAPAGDDPLANMNFFGESDVESVSRIPKLHEFIGIEPASDPATHESQILGALHSGTVGQYAKYLRAEWEGLTPGTPGRRELYANMKQLERESARYERVERPQVERQIAIEKAVRQRLAEDEQALLGEQDIAQTIPGQVALHAEAGLSFLPRAVLELGARAVGQTGFAQRLADEREFRSAYLAAIEEGGQGEQLLGKTGSTILNAVTESLVPMGAAGKLAGRPGVYTAVGMTGMADGLAEAKRMQLEGKDALAYATMKTGAELALMSFVGKLGKGLGFDSVEEILSTRGRAVMAKIAGQIDLPGKLHSALKVGGGAGFEAFEEGLTSAIQQLVEINADPSKPFSFERFLTEAGAGAAGGTVAGVATIPAETRAIRRQAAQEIEDLINKRSFEIAEIARGGADAEHALSTMISTQPMEGGGLGPVEVTLPAPRIETALPSTTETAVGEGVGAVSAETGVQEGEGGQELSAFATYPEDIDVVLQRAQAEDFVKSLTPEKQAALFARFTGRETVTTPGDVVSARETATPGATLRVRSMPAEPTIEMIEKVGVGDQRTTATGAPVTSQTDTDQQNFTELTGIENTTAQYRDAFVGVLEAYAPPMGQPAVPEAVRQAAELSPHRTREDIRIAARDRQIQFQKETVARLRQDVRGARELRQDWLDDVTLLIESNVPRDHQGSFLNAIRKVSSPAKFNRLLDRVDRWVTRSDYGQAWNRFDFARSEAKNLSADWAKEAGIAREGVSKFKRPDLSKMTIDEINAAIDDLDDRTKRLTEARHNSDMAHVWHRLGVDIKRDDAIRKTAEEGAKAKPLAMSTASGFRQFIPKWLRSDDLEEDPHRNLWTFLRPTNSPIMRELSMRPEAILNDFSPTARKILVDDFFVDGVYERDAIIDDADAQLGTLLEGLGLGYRHGVSVAQQGGKVLSPLERWRETYQEIGGTRMSRGEALLLHLNLRDPETAERLRENGGVLTHRKRRKFGPVDEFFEADLANFIGREGLVLADHIFARINNEVIDPVNRATEEVDGHPATTRRNHFPRRIDDEDIPLDDTKFDKKWRAATLESVIQKRTEAKHRVKIDGDAIDFYMRHVNKMATYAAFYPRLRDARAYLDDPTVKQAIVGYGGDTMYDMLHDRINRQVAPRQVPTSVGEQASQAITRMAAGSRLALRPAPIVKQALSIPAVISNSLPGAEKYVTHALATDRVGLEERMNRNPMARQRWNSNRYVHEYTNGLVAQTGYFRPTSITDRLLSPLNYGERKLTGAVKQAAAEFNVSRRMDPTDPDFEKEVQKEWYRLTIRSDNNAEGFELNSMQAYARDHALAAPLVMFTSSATRTFTMAMQAMSEIARGDFSSGGRKLSGVLAIVLGEALIDELFSREDIDGDFAERATKRVAAKLASINPNLQNFAEPIVRSVLGMKIYTDEVHPLLSLTESGGIALSELAKSMSSNDPKHLEKMFDAIQDVGTDVTPLGSVEDLLTEDLEDPLPGLTR